MLSIFIVLGVILLVVPVTCTIFALHSNNEQKKRAELIKNATAIKTTVRPGPNGRTVFEAKRINTSPSGIGTRKKSPPRSPILPTTQQQAHKKDQSKSGKTVWQRLSRPFSLTPTSMEEDQIELTQNLKGMPLHSASKRHTQNEYEAPVSPPTPHSFNMGISSSWRTYGDIESRDPVSPLSVTNLPASSSITGTIIRGHQPHNLYTSQQFQGVHQRSEYMHDVPLTPPSWPKPVKKSNSKIKSVLDVGTSRGFMPPDTLSGARYDIDDIKTNIVDANHKKLKNIRLATPPKAKVNKRQ